MIFTVVRQGFIMFYHFKSNGILGLRIDREIKAARMILPVENESQIIEVVSIHASLLGSNFSFCRDVSYYLSVRLYSLQRRSPHKHGSLHCIIQLPYSTSISGHLGIFALLFDALFCSFCCFSEIMLFSLVHFKSSF